ncbi:hypothetical protein QBC38DRAFT_474048 [Podospora fimiseda]|uniref:Actin-like ATPase domain-containing protein n=1 Tax=Podospora fimiseda TaxID=252190 RepID=A0AAN7H497_9PEZI|nr:hypothetical protein QBC38DRAFT_474048 [Podospora fimiseda]
MPPKTQKQQEATLYIGVDFNASTTGISAILFPKSSSSSSFSPTPIRIPLQDRNTTIYTCPTRLPDNPITGEYGYPVPAKNYPWLPFTSRAPLTHLPIALNQPDQDLNHPAWKEIQAIHTSNYSPGSAKQKSISACAEFLRRFWYLGILRSASSGLVGWQNLSSIIITASKAEHLANLSSPNKEPESLPPSLSYNITKIRFYFAAPLPHTQPNTYTHSSLSKSILRSGIVSPFIPSEKSRQTPSEQTRNSTFKILNAVDCSAIGTLSLFGGIQRYLSTPIQKGDAALVLNIGELNIDIAAYKYRTPPSNPSINTLPQIRSLQPPAHIISGEYQVRQLFDELIKDRIDPLLSHQNNKNSSPSKDPRIWHKQADQLWLQIKNTPDIVLQDEHQRYRIMTKPNSQENSFTIGGPTILEVINQTIDWIMDFINGYVESVLANEELQKRQLKYFVVTGSFANFRILIDRLETLRPDIPWLQVIVPVQAADAACLGATLYAYDKHLLRGLDSK